MSEDTRANTVGECYLKTAFPSKKTEAYSRGYYTHLDYAPTFSEVIPGSVLHDRMLLALGLDFAIIENTKVFGFDEYATFGEFNETEVTIVTDGTLVVGGYYDGDGVVVAGNLVTGAWVQNTDMKCAYYWHTIEAPTENAKPNDATASAIATRAAYKAYRKERAILAKIGQGFQENGMPSLDAECETCLSGSIAIIPFCPTCKRGPHSDESYAADMDPDTINTTS
jgi:hypothetical protein